MCVGISSDVIMTYKCYRSFSTKDGLFQHAEYHTFEKYMMHIQIEYSHFKFWTKIYWICIKNYAKRLGWHQLQIQLHNR